MLQAAPTAATSAAAAAAPGAAAARRAHARSCFERAGAWLESARLQRGQRGPASTAGRLRPPPPSLPKHYSSRRLPAVAGAYIASKAVPAFCLLGEHRSSYSGSQRGNVARRNRQCQSLRVPAHEPFPVHEVTVKASRQELADGALLHMSIAMT